MRFANGIGILLIFASAAKAQQHPIVDFPTGNHALAEGRPEDFYMYVDRDFEGVKTKPWEGGQYGFVRGPHRIGGAVICTSIHEGIDIKPMQRDAAGNPLDAVMAAADGKVVHASKDAGASNYGRYIVMEHLIGGSPYYSLYAHLASLAVEEGQAVRQGQQIGVMGFTGDGIDRTRAHTHFEFCLMLSRSFEQWHERFYPADPNRHGLYNGRNLLGVNPAELLLSARRNGAAFDIPRFIRSGEPFFKATVNNSPHLDLLHMYPWLVSAGSLANPPAWTITFSRFGVPLAAAPAAAPVSEPALVWAKPSSVPYASLTRGLLGGSGANPILTDSGRRFLSLLTFPD